MSCAKKHVLGITGSIASGKSARCEHLMKLLNTVATSSSSTTSSNTATRTLLPQFINADVIGGQVRDEHATEVIAAFGNGIVDNKTGGIDVPSLAKLVFEPGDVGRKRLDTLNGIVWPPLKQRIGRTINEAPEFSVIVLEAALLVEIGLTEFCDEVWILHASRDMALQRLMMRNPQLTQEQACARIDAQMTWQEREAMVEDMISRGGKREATSGAAQKEEGMSVKTRFLKCVDTSAFADLDSGLLALERDLFPRLLENVHDCK